MTTKTATPATEKQIAFLRSLITQVEGDNAPEALLILDDVVADGLVSTKQASASIDRYLARAKAAKATAAPSTNFVTAGYYAVDGDIYKVVPNREGTRHYAKRLIVATGNGRGSWTYVPGAMNMIQGKDALTLEQAKEFGSTHGFCIACGALLTDPESVAAGIGPVCAAKF